MSKRNVTIIVVALLDHSFCVLRRALSSHFWPSFFKINCIPSQQDSHCALAIPRRKAPNNKRFAETMRALLWFTIIVRATLCLRGDDDASGTLSLSHRGQRRLQSSEDAPRQPLDDKNLFRRDSAHNEHDEEVEQGVTTENYSSSNDTQVDAETEFSSGKRGPQVSKGKKGSISKSMKSSTKEKLSSKKSSKSSHSVKKKKHGKGRMNHVSGKGQTSGPSASHHHSSKIHVSGKGKGSSSSPPASSPLLSPNQSPVFNPSPVLNPSPSSPTVNPPNGTPTPPTASGPTASPTSKFSFEISL